ncbi:MULTISPECIES: SPOR domain-containing protein [unclassified Pseudomonas]|uniref:SPOR domain-containing protein n=1 Tax=unclassified Pseudomonas TaxID=196821 RepID=UPI003850535A
MHSAMLSKTHFNGYDVINVNNGPWRVCTDHDRLGSFGTREEAMAFAASLPAYKERAAMKAQVNEDKPEKKAHRAKDETRH